MIRVTKLGERSAKALKEDYAAWVAWCRRHRFRAMPAAARELAGWVNELFDNNEVALATIRRRLWAIGRQHVLSGHPNPTSHIIVLRAMARIADSAPPQRKAEILSDADVRAMLQTQADTVIGRRNRALLAVAVSVQLLRSKLVAVDWKQVDIVDPARARIAVAGRWIPLSPEAGTALHDWHTELRAVEILHGAVFRAVDRHGNIGERLGGAEVNRIFRSMGRAAEIDKLEITSRSVFGPARDDRSACSCGNPAAAGPLEAIAVAPI
jgi:integrase